MPSALHCLVLTSLPEESSHLPRSPTCHLLLEDFLISPASASAPSGSLSSLLCAHRSLLSYVVLILSMYLLYHTPHFMSLGLRFIYVGIPMGGGWNVSPPSGLGILRRNHSRRKPQLVSHPRWCTWPCLWPGMLRCWSGHMCIESQTNAKWAKSAQKRPVPP